MGTEVRNIINDVLSACIGSCEAEPIMLHEPTYKKGYFPIHSQLHVMFNAPPGFGKSSLIDQIPKKIRVETIDYTKPGILGSIKKTGEFVDGSITRAAGKLWIVDEHHKVPENARGSITSLLENQRASRALAYNIVGNFKPIKKKMIRMSVDKGLINIDYLRFSSIWLGIYQPKKRFDDRALASRFMPVSLIINWDELKRVSKGWSPIEIKYSKSPGGQTFDAWEKFVDIYCDSVEIFEKGIKRPFFMQNPEFPRRGMLHFSRLFSWASGSNSVIDDWEKYIPYIPLFVYNTIASTLTLIEYDVLCMLKNDMNQREIASELNINESSISKVVSRLEDIGLAKNLAILRSI